MSEVSSHHDNRDFDSVNGENNIVCLTVAFGWRGVLASATTVCNGVCDGSSETCAGLRVR